MKIIIAGSRTFHDFPALMGFMSVLPQEWDITEVVSGCAVGADKLGEWFSEHIKVPLTRFPADWDTHGRKAGIMRNMEMGNYSDGLIAFWDGKSAGTKHMITYMYSLNKPVHIFYVGHLIARNN